MTEKKNDLELTVVVGCGGLLFHSMGSMMCAENGRGGVGPTMFVDADGYQTRNNLRQPWMWAQPQTAGKQKSWLASKKWQEMGGNADARSVMMESRKQLVELVGEMWEQFTDDGKRNTERLIVIALPDNDKARSVCANGAVLISEKWPSKEVWFVTAGNNLEGGQAIGYRLRGGRWEDERITAAHDELWNPEEEQEGTAHCDADMLQSRESNMLTAVCIGNVLDDLGALQAGTEWYWMRGAGLYGDPPSASMWQEHIWIDPDKDDEQEEEV